jgi:Periplasmic binding protein-like domain
MTSRSASAPATARLRYAGSRAVRPASGQAAVHTDATAVLAFNDLLAIGILERLVERGLRVPANMSVMRCDDIFGADAPHPRHPHLSPKPIPPATGQFWVGGSAPARSKGAIAGRPRSDRCG